jgi:hypothetical protein
VPHPCTSTHNHGSPQWVLDRGGHGRATQRVSRITRGRYCSRITRACRPGGIRAASVTARASHSGRRLAPPTGAHNHGQRVRKRGTAVSCVWNARCPPARPTRAPHRRHGARSRVARCAPGALPTPRRRAGPAAPTPCATALALRGAGGRGSGRWCGDRRGAHDAAVRGSGGIDGSTHGGARRGETATVSFNADHLTGVVAWSGKAGQRGRRSRSCGGARSRKAR